MKAIFLWSLHDFPTFGTVAGCVTKGYRVNPICGPHTISRRSRGLHKNVYDDQYRRWLPCGHAWRSNATYFNEEVELWPPPFKVTAIEIMR